MRPRPSPTVPPEAPPRRRPHFRAGSEPGGPPSHSRRASRGGHGGAWRAGLLAAVLGAVMVGASVVPAATAQAPSGPTAGAPLTVAVVSSDGQEVVRLAWDSVAGPDGATPTGYDVFIGRTPDGAGRTWYRTVPPRADGGGTVDIPATRRALGRYYSVVAVYADGARVDGYSVGTGPASYVALGDSFSAGQGVPPFEPGTGRDVDDAGGNTCHRSLASYSRLLVNEPALAALAGETTFAACSGAITADALAQNLDDDLPEPAQVSRVDQFTDLITLSMGGNDLGFSAMAVACAAGDCADYLRQQPALAQRFDFPDAAARDKLNLFASLAGVAQFVHDGIGLDPQFVIQGLYAALFPPARTGDQQSSPLFAHNNVLVDRLATVYVRLADQAPHAQIQVVPYPQLLGGLGSSEPCTVGTVVLDAATPPAAWDLNLDAAERVEISRLIDGLNQDVAAAVEAANARLAGLTGTPGSAGLTGTPGSAGLTGTPGSAGLTGTPGSAGLTGTPGSGNSAGSPGSAASAGPGDRAPGGQRIHLVPPAVVQAQFAGHRLCENGGLNPDAYVNSVRLPALPGITSGGGTEPMSYSLHPNGLGQQALERAVRPYVNIAVGRAAPGQAASLPGVDVMAGVAGLRLEATWPAGTALLSVIGPDGTVVDATSPGVASGGDATSAWLVVPDPAPGTWTPRVAGASVVTGDGGAAGGGAGGAGLAGDDAAPVGGDGAAGPEVEVVTTLELAGAPSPNAVVEASLAGGDPRTVTFDAMRSTGSPGLAYSWFFPDGEIASGAAVTHRFAVGQPLRATLRLDDGVSTPSWAWGGVNTAPTAADDMASVKPDKALTVAAPGLLANDTDVDGDPLVAVLDQAPAHGNLTLNADGSYVYTPAAGFVGLDSFAYHVDDGTAASSSAAVTLGVGVPAVPATPASSAPPSITASPGSTASPAPGVTAPPPIPSPAVSSGPNPAVSSGPSPAVSSGPSPAVSSGPSPAVSSGPSPPVSSPAGSAAMASRTAVGTAASASSSDPTPAPTSRPTPPASPSGLSRTGSEVAPGAVVVTFLVIGLGAGLLRWRRRLLGAWVRTMSRATNARRKAG